MVQTSTYSRHSTKALLQNRPDGQPPTLRRLAMQRRSLLLSSASLLAFEGPLMAATRSTPTSLAYEQPGAVALAAAMAEGHLTSERLVRDCLARIAAIDRAGPKLHSVIELNPDALAIARALDGERKAGRVRGPLHGLPVLVKDNIATSDRMSTSCGSLALDGMRAPRDAHVSSACATPAR